MNLKESIKKMRKSLVRILVFKTDGKTVAGTGFYIGNSLFLTCAHVVFASDGTKKFEEELCALQNEKDEAIKLFQKRVSKIEIVTESGVSLGGAKLEDFTFDYDAATLSLEKQPDLQAINRGDPMPTLEMGEKIAFCGFPASPSYPDKRTSPLMLNEGIISGFPNERIGGFPKYKHIQINAVSIGGFSGSPLFLENSGIVIGIINGNRTQPISTIKIIPQQKLESKLTMVPIGIASATELAILPILKK